MQRLSILRKTLRDLRWQVFWYGLGLALMAALVVYIYPDYREQFADFEIPDALQGLVGDADFTTGTGFITAEILSWYPIILVVFAIMGGSSAVGGEEAGGTLDLVLAQPVSRRRLLLEKLGGLLLAALGICVLIYAGWLVSVPFVDIEVGFADLAVATLNFLPLVALFQVFSLWASVTLSSRGLATGVAVAVAVVSYFVNYLSSIVDLIEPLRYASVFYHYHGTEVLSEGIDPLGLGLLVGLYLFLAAWALANFERRDLGVGAVQSSRPPWKGLASWPMRFVSR
jgi:ABC-2 type transport system permease protein